MAKSKSAKSKVNPVRRKKLFKAAATEFEAISSESAAESLLSDVENIAPNSLDETTSMTSTDNDNSDEENSVDPPSPAAPIKKISSKVKAAKVMNLSDRAEHMRSVVAFNKHRGILRKKARTMTQRANLNFPVARIRGTLNAMFSGKMIIQRGAACYLAGVLEYLVAEVTELAGNVAKDFKKRRIVPRHVMLAVKNDDELDKLLKDVTFAKSGVLGTVHPSLLPKRK